MVLSQLSISPVGENVSLSKYVKKVIEILHKNNLKYEINDMSTVIETNNIKDLFKTVEEAHNAVFNLGAKRVITELKIDDRRDKKVLLGSKVNSLK